VSFILFYFCFDFNFGASNSVLFAFEVTSDLSAQSLQLYDVDGSALRFEAPSKAALLDCCFQNESVAFIAASDGSVTRLMELNPNRCFP
jgi:hypothetical protein